MHQEPMQPSVTTACQTSSLQQIPHACTAVKPLWRGVMHSYACAAVLAAGSILVLEARTGVGRLSALVYVAAAALQFFVSALYHTQEWGPHMHKLLMRIDHSAIYGLIAATYTPLVSIPLGFDSLLRNRLLLRVWLGALCGVGKTWLWPQMPRLLSALTYVAMGWSAVPYLPVLAEAVDAHVVLLVAAGGVMYTLGAFVYATRFPDPYPKTFGFHEVFHTFVVAATICHFAACYHVVVKMDATMHSAVPAAAAAVAPAASCLDMSCWQRLWLARLHVA